MIIVRGDVGGRGAIWVEANGHEVYRSCWEDLGSAGVAGIIELSCELAARLNVEFKDETE